MAFEEYRKDSTGKRVAGSTHLSSMAR